MQQRATIKGIFVNSHLKALERAGGESALRDLQAQLGLSLEYGNTEDVPIIDEITILEFMVDLVHSKQLEKKDRARAVGRLHFRNFTATQLWKGISMTLGNDLKTLLMQSNKIAGYVFRNSTFHAVDSGERCVTLTMTNADYPLEHFQGFFEEWLTTFGLSGVVEASSPAPCVHEYQISWNEPHVHVTYG